jgi:hypothetical protein
VRQKEGDTSVSSSDCSGGRRIRLEVAAGEFERFLMADKGVSVATRECYVRHVVPFLTELADPAAWLPQLAGCLVCVLA